MRKALQPKIMIEVLSKFDKAQIRMKKALFLDRDGVIIHDEFDNEARRTYENLGRVLRGAGLDFDRVVQVRCYLQRQEDWDAHNRIYREYFSEPFPARTTLVGCLGDLVKYEVDCVAYAGPGHSSAS